MFTQHRWSCFLITLALIDLSFPLCTMADNGQGPAKWLQRPDESPTGLDVTAHPVGIGYGLFLADDFRCQISGPITGVRLWTSWLNDKPPVPQGAGQPDPNHMEFSLTIHEDAPPSAQVPFSHPGQQIWSGIFRSGDFTSKVWKSDVAEQFYDPMHDRLFGADTVIWQYDFAIEPGKAFVQQVGTVYWLAAHPLPWDDVALMGWKTSVDHRQNGAVFGFMHGVPPLMWGELRYPQDASIVPSLRGMPIDLAFELTTVPEPAGALLLAAACGCLMLRLGRHSSFNARKS